jgi:hypothetical protein
MLILQECFGFGAVRGVRRNLQTGEVKSNEGCVCGFGIYEIKKIKNTPIQPSILVSGFNGSSGKF